jgi:hypothetical protein
MSLINDALKRASTQKPVAPAASGPVLQPVENSSEEKSTLPMVLGIVGVGAILIAGAFWLKSKGTSNGPEPLAQKPVEKPKVTAVVESKPAFQNPIERANATLQKVAERNSEETSVTVPATVPVSTQPAPLIPATTPAPAVSAPVVSTPAVAMVVPPPRASTPAAEPAPEPVKAQPVVQATPSFRLQAIYYRMHGPTVIINGKTLKIGDEVDGAKLIDIERTSAEIDVQGKRQKLTMHY